MKCNYCEFRCDLDKTKGVCGRYTVRDGEVKELEPMKLLTPYFYQMEEMPFFHAMPGALVAQTGTKSCNAACEYCINSHVAMEETEVHLREFTPQQLVSYVKENNGRAIVFGVNEVACFMQTAAEIADAAHREGILMGCLTNGFETEEAAHILAEKMDFINLSLKAIDDEMYRDMLHLPYVEPILRNIRIFAEKTHLEIVTPLVPELGQDKLLEIASFIASVDKNIPWHLFRLQPANNMMQTAKFNAAQTVKVIEEAKKILSYVYLGNLAGSRWVNTVCPKCGKTLIKRVCLGSCGSKFMSKEIEGNTCPDCGEEIPMII